MIGFINTKQLEKHDCLPNIEIMFVSGVKDNYVFPKLLNIKESIRQKWSKYIGINGYTIQ